MNKIIKCDCGMVIQAETDEELVARGQKHALEIHHLTLTPEQLLAMATPA
jgi:predicted small metal-binding protein